MRSPVRRPAGRRGVELAIGELERVAAVGRHQPELVPLPAEVGAVHHAPTVAAPVGPRLPGGLLVADLARPGHSARAAIRQNPAGAPDVAAVGDRGSAPGRPATRPARGTGPTVCSSTAGRPLSRSSRDAARPRRSRRLARPATTKTCQRPWYSGGREGDPAAVGRPARLEVDGAVRHERRPTRRWRGRAAEARSRRRGRRRRPRAGRRETSRAGSRSRARR